MGVHTVVYTQECTKVGIPQVRTKVGIPQVCTRVGIPGVVYRWVYRGGV